MSRRACAAATPTHARPRVAPACRLSSRNPSRGLQGGFFIFWVVEQFSRPIKDKRSGGRGGWFEIDRLRAAFSVGVRRRVAPSPAIGTLDDGRKEVVAFLGKLGRVL